MSILKKFLENKTPFAKIGVVDYFKNTFADGFTKKITGTSFRTDATSKFSRKIFIKYDPTK